MEKKTRQEIIDEVVNINGNQVYVENGEVKMVLSEEIQKTGYMSVEESRALTLEGIKKVYALNNGLFDEK